MNSGVLDAGEVENLKDIKKTGRWQSKSFFLTYSQCPLSKEVVLAEVKARVKSYKGAVVCEEKHANGDPHLHVYLSLGKELDTTNCRYFDIGEYHANMQSCKNADRVRVYVQKDGNFLQDGEVDIKAKLLARLEHKKLINTSLMDGSLKVKDYMKQNPQDLMQFPNVIKALQCYRLMCLESRETEDIKGYWIYGRTGCGKSHAVKKHPVWKESLFEKMCNHSDKWFDGYDGEKVLHLMDLSPAHEPMIDDLKLWLDKWGSKAQFKGGLLNLQHETLVVTSNYHPRDIWDSEKRKPCLEALMRRCKIIHFTEAMRGMDPVTMVEDPREQIVEKTYNCGFDKPEMPVECNVTCNMFGLNNN